jgi:hypothetical protein
MGFADTSNVVSNLDLAGLKRQGLEIPIRPKHNIGYHHRPVGNIGMLHWFISGYLISGGVKEQPRLLDRGLHRINASARTIATGEVGWAFFVEASHHLPTFQVGKQQPGGRCKTISYVFQPLPASAQKNLMRRNPSHRTVSSRRQCALTFRAASVVVVRQ